MTEILTGRKKKMICCRMQSSQTFGMALVDFCRCMHQK